MKTESDTPKVIEFPTHRVVREVPAEHLMAREKKQTQRIADSIIDEIMGLVLCELDNYDIRTDNEEFIKDIVLVTDTLRSAIYRQYDLEHYFQPYVEKHVKLLDGNPDDMTQEELAQKIEELMKRDLDKETEE